MGNIIALAVILALVGAAIFAIYRSKKRGQKCIGCPSGGSCSSCNGNCHK